MSEWVGEIGVMRRAEVLARALQLWFKAAYVKAGSPSYRDFEAMTTLKNKEGLVISPGIVYSNMGQILAGKRAVTLEHVCQISETLGPPLSEILRTVADICREAERTAHLKDEEIADALAEEARRISLHPQDRPLYERFIADEKSRVSKSSSGERKRSEPKPESATRRSSPRKRKRH